jgi:hypothetical protein
MVLIAACSEATVLPTSTLQPPTPTSTRTLIAKTGTPQPFTTTTPVIVIEDPLQSHTATPETQQFTLPKEKVAILRPASGSNVTSPFRVNGYAGPSWNNRVELRLIGENGREITKAITYLISLPGNAGPFSVELNFETSLVAESARLEVSVFSKDDARMDHLASVNLILLSIGSPRSHWTIHGPEQIQILSPKTYERLEGGVISLSGLGWTKTEGPLQVEVLDWEGNVLTATTATIASPGPDQVGTFEVEIPYQIDQAQRGRIVVYELSRDIPGIIHYASVIVNLRP